MSARVSLPVWLLLQLLCCSSLVWAVQPDEKIPPPRSAETSDFLDVQKTAMEMGRKYHPENVLLVFDIDNTLLASTDDLGSVQWFRWQEKLLAEDRESPALVGKDFGGLLRAQGLLFATGDMRLTQPELPAIVRDLQSTGFYTLLLTSRGYEFRDSTRQALFDNGLNFGTSAMFPKEGYPSPFFPYDMERLVEVGFTPEEATALKIKKPRLVDYGEGVYLTAGQHKGIILRALLKKADVQPKAIVFTDDQSKHIAEMEEAFANQPIEVVAYRLTREDAWAEGFADDKQRQSRCISQWQKLLAALPGTAAEKYSPPVVVEK